MAHTNSMTWISPEVAEKDRWDMAEKGMKRMRFDRSPFVPKNHKEWLLHRAVYTADQAEYEKQRLAGLATRQYKLSLTLDGKTFNDSRSLVLSYYSAWTPGFRTAGGGDVAPWPAPDEFREEGDERHTSGFRRFLPVPRAPSNETVPWKLRAFKQPSPMDSVFPVPVKEEKNNTGSPLDCRPSTARFFYGPFAVNAGNWNTDSNSYSDVETTHWVDRAEAIVRYLNDEPLSTEGNTRLPCINEEEGESDNSDNSNASEDEGVPLST